MLSTIKEYIKKENLIERGDNITLGVSGGADSVCLLFVMKELYNELSCSVDVVHVIHGIRGEDADMDAEFVSELCQKLDIKCRVESVDVPSFAKDNKLSIEEAARVLRYKVFFENKKSKIAVAHHAEDNAETILMQLLRGTGIVGLGGMAPKSEVQGCTIIRPLLCLRRAEIEEYLDSIGQSYRNDVTNEDVAYTRNRLRHEVFPILEQINSSAIEHMNNTAALIREWNEDIEHSASLILEEVRNDKDILRGELLKYPIALQKEVIKLWLHELTKGARDISKFHIEETVHMLSQETGKSMDLPGNYRVISDYDTIKVLAEDESYKYVEEFEEEFVRLPELEEGDTYEEIFGDYQFYFAVLENDGDQPPKDDFEKWMDYDKIKEDLVIRTRREGDYIYISGGKKKSFGRVCIDEKISRDDRERIPLICSGEHVLWAVGHKFSEGAKVTSDTKLILSIDVVR